MDASAVSESVKPRRKLPQLTRWQKWAISLGIVALLIGVWMWRQPRSMRMVGRFPAVDVTLLPTSTGFLLHEKADLFVLREWTKGEPAWQVTTPPGKGHRNIALSQDGRYFAVMTPAGSDRRVQVWRDGNLTSDLLLPKFPVKRALLRITDGGRVFIWYNMNQLWHAMVIEQGRVIATGMLGKSEGPASISPDGKIFVAKARACLRYAKLTVTGSKLARSHEYIITGSVELPGYTTVNGFDTLFAEGYVVTDDGTIYNDTGQVSGPDKRSETFYVAPGGRYTLRYNENTVRVFSPITGDAWEFPARGENQGGDVTGDGRYAQVCYVVKLPPQLVALLQKASETFGHDFSEEMSYVAIYERPGKLRAVLNMRPSKWWKHYGESVGWWWFPAADGHGLVTNMEDTSGRSECLLFRW